MADDREEGAAKIHVEICALERPLVCIEATEVTVPGGEGVFTVLPGHTPVLSTLTAGVLVARQPDGTDLFYAVNGGFVEVLDDRVTVLAQTAERDDEIDEDRAGAARERAEQRLRKPAADIDLMRAEAALDRALARQMARSHTGYD